jgi:pilus assembly protein CpaC
LLQVKFAEVDRSVLSQLGLNVFSTGAGNTIGNITTGQFGGSKIGAINDTFGVPASPAPNVPVPTTGPNTVPFTSSTTVNDLLNIFLFNPDIHLGTTIKALQTKNLLQILAEPNLIAVNGKEASFLAGGEFPFPIVQPGNGFTAVSIQFKEFGVRLKFTPVIMPNGNIHLRVIPEVSQLDFTNALTISGFTIPALSTRRADTEFELQDGQSFVIAGLMNNQVSNIVNKVPGLGDIPILGNFFKSKATQKSNAELMVLCTARLVAPPAAPPPLPKNPEPLLDNHKFDGKKPSGK